MEKFVIILLGFREYLYLIKRISFFGLALLPGLSEGQIDTTLIRKRYDSEVIRYGTFRYKKGGVTNPRINLKNEFDNSNQGLAMFKAHNREQLKSFGSFTIGVLSLVGSVYAGKQGHPKLSRILEAGFYIGAGFSIYFTIKSSKKLNYAVWLRNRDVLLLD